MFSLILNLYKHDFKFPLKSFDYSRLRLSLRVLESWGVGGVLEQLKTTAKKSLFANKKAKNLQAADLKSTKTTKTI